MAKIVSRHYATHQTVGYLLGSRDSRGSTFAGTDGPDIPVDGHCQACGGTLDFERTLQNVWVRGAHDIFSIDGRTIVNQRFKNFCLDRKYKDIEFRVVLGKPLYYELRATRILKVDTEILAPYYENFCIRCGNYSSCLHTRGLMLQRVRSPLDDGFYRTDLWFGSSVERQPRLIVAPVTKEKIEAQNFRSTYFIPIPFINPYYRPLQQQVQENWESTFKLQCDHYALEREMRALKGEDIDTEFDPNDDE